MKGRRWEAPAMAASAPGWTSPASKAIRTRLQCRLPACAGAVPSIKDTLDGVLTGRVSRSRALVAARTASTK